jgi:O-antigen/teichoic acid export membrane protein
MSEPRAWLGALALTTAQSIRYVMQFAVLPLLARMLGPEAYGVIGLAMPFVLLSNMFADLGLGNALSRTPAPSDALESTVFWLALSGCATLAIGLCLIAWPAGLALSAPQLTPVLMALSSVLLLSGLLAVPNSRIMRERRFGVFAVGDVMASALAAGLAIAAAYLHFGVWSLVVQQLTLWLVKTAWVFSASRFRPILIFRPSLAREHLAFGVNAAASNIVDFISKSAPTLVIGWMLGVVAVGHYALASQIIRLPDGLIAGPVYLVVFTAVARLNDRRQEASALALRALSGVAIGIAPMFAGLALIADLAAPLLLGEKWAPAAPVVTAISLAGFLIAFYSIVGAVLMGLGRSDLQFRATLAGGIAMALGACAGARINVAWAAAGLSAGALAAGPYLFILLRRELGLPGGAVLHALAPPLLATLFMMASVLLVRMYLQTYSPLVQLIWAVATGVGAFGGGIFALMGRTLLRDLRARRAGRTEGGWSALQS